MRSGKKKYSVCSRPSLRQTLPENQREALDVLLFIFYARGMVFKDVYGLTHRMVTDRHIRYLRSKTGVPIDVEVVPELEEIMKRYHRKIRLSFSLSCTRQGKDVPERSCRKNPLCGESIVQPV